MKSSPYFSRLLRDKNGYGLYFIQPSGSTYEPDQAERVASFDSVDDVSKAEQIANEAFYRGKLQALRAQKHQNYLENQRLLKLIEALDNE